MTTQQQTQQQNQQKIQGQVKFFNKDRGFGFIKDVNSNTEYFVHHTAVHPQTRCWNVLYKGEYVEFSIVDGNKGKQADNVTGLNGGSLMCDNEFEYRRRRAQKRKMKKTPVNNSVNN